MFPYVNSRSMINMLKELYGGPIETEVIKRWKTSSLSELEFLIHDEEINKYKNDTSGLKHLVFQENPLLKMIKNEKQIR